MTTLGDVYRLVAKVTWNVALFGCTPDFKVTLDSLTIALGQAIATEQGNLTPSQARQLASETVLGPSAQAAFDRLVQFVNAPPSDTQSVMAPPKT